MAEALAKRRQLAEAQLREEAETLLSRTRVRIKALRMDQANPNRFREMEHAYQNVYEAAKAARDYAFLYDYASFLYHQNRFPEAIRVAEKLKHLYDDPDQKNSVRENDRGNLLNLIEALYASVHHPQLAEQFYREALEIRRRLAQTVSRNAYELGVTRTCNNLGIFCADHGKPDEAEKLYKEALDIRRRLAQTVSRDAYEPEVATTCSNLGVFCKNYGKPDEAEKLYREALGIYRRPAQTVSRNAYEPQVVRTLFNMSLFYRKRDPARAEECRREAKQIAERHKDVNPLCRRLLEALSE